MTFNEELPVIYRLKLYALFINGENEAALYSVICYIEVSIKGCTTVYKNLRN